MCQWKVKYLYLTFISDNSIPTTVYVPVEGELFVLDSIFARGN